MPDLNLFDIVPALSFDLPDKNTKKIKKALEMELKNADDRMRGENSNEAKKKQYKEQRDFLQKTIECFFGKDNSKSGDEEVKDKNSEYNRQANEKKEEAIILLRSSVELLYETGLRFYTKSTINEFKNKTRLSKETIEVIFKEIGLVATSIDAFGKDPKKHFPKNGDDIVAELSALRETKEPRQVGLSTSVVTDLYSFAVFLSGGEQSAEAFRKMPASELSDFFGRESQKAQKLSGTLYASLLKSLTSKAKGIFSSEDGKTAYDEFERYRSDELTKLFKKMKNGVPRSLLLSDKFALPCIDIITKYFPDAEVALAIYNTEAGFNEDEYYIYPSNVFVVKCPKCQYVNKYESEEEAQKKNSCQNCGDKLYKKCDKCGRLVLKILDTCPHCGYVFASAALFSKFFQQAEAAFRKSDFDAARQYLFQAQTAAPGEKTRIDQLAKQIDKEEAILKEPINRLRQLIAERKFHTARTELGAIIKKYPNLNVYVFNQTVTSELSRADKLFASAGSSSASKKADTCITILLQCADYPPALSFIRATAPLPCSSITVTPVSSTGIINISWSHSTEQGISYRLIRKTGRVAASSENDGDILADKITATSFTDERIKPGQIYTYSVFTTRLDVYSSPASKSGTLYSDVKNCHVSQRGAGVRITWDAPDNSRGATVIRTCEGKSVTLTDNAHGSYEDSGTQYGKTYIYKVFANYDGTNRSTGVESVITPLPTVDSFSIRAVQVKENTYKVSWTIKQPGIDLRIMVNGKLSIESKSEDGTVQVNLPRETYCRIDVLAYSGGKWINSDNSVEVNTYTSCAIDKKLTYMEERMISGRNGISYRIDLKIYLAGEVPANASAFYYTVRTAKSENRWADLEEVGKAVDIQKISLATYQKQGFIPYQDFVMSETTFFISVFTCYSTGGKEIVSEPQKMKIDRPLNANLFWAVSYGMFDGLQLTITLSGNKPIEYVPELILCVCDANQFIASQDDKNVQVLMRIPSVDLTNSVTEYRKTYPVKTALPAKYLKKCKYFLFEQDTTDGDNIMLRWKQGFSGKV